MGDSKRPSKERQAYIIKNIIYPLPKTKLEHVHKYSSFNII